MRKGSIVTSVHVRLPITRGGCDCQAPTRWKATTSALQLPTIRQSTPEQAPVGGARLTSARTPYFAQKHPDKRSSEYKASRRCQYHASQHPVIISQSNHGIHAANGHGYKVWSLRGHKAGKRALHCPEVTPLSSRRCSSQHRIHMPSSTSSRLYRDTYSFVP